MQRVKLLFLISMGAILEYYDFAIFLYLAPLIGKSLIPVANVTMNLILSYAILGVGAVCRPLGGLVFAHIGDTLGRSKTFVYTVLFMGIPTLGIAFIPNVGLIGVWATIILIGLRVFQGFAIGGEIPGSIVFGYEIAAGRRKALSSAVVVMGTNVGFVCASIVCTILLKMTYLGHFANWRIAFILGGCFGIGSYFLRKKIVETPEFQEYKNTLSHERVPLAMLLQSHRTPVLQILGLSSFLASSLAVFTFYMPNYLAQFYHLPLHTLMEFNSYTIVIFIVGALIAGIYDKYFAKTFFLYFIPAFCVAALILFNLYPVLSLAQILTLHVLMLLLLGLLCGRLPVLCATFFPVSVRYTGVALSYNISFGIVAGLSQVILTWLIAVTGILAMPAIYVSVFGCFALWALTSMDNQQLIDYR